MTDFLIPESTVVFEQTLKKSRFIASLAHAADAEQAHLFINSVRAAYPDAGHVCWAFVAGAPNNTTNVSCSDDGEPNGTAGKPMLNVLQHSAIGEIVAVVVRYFGGTKLGTGGLVRAYSGSVSEALKKLPTCLRVEQIAVCLAVPYALESDVRYQLDQFDAAIEQLSYETMWLTLDCLCHAQQWPALKQKLADVGRGQIRVTDGSEGDGGPED